MGTGVGSRNSGAKWRRIVPFSASLLLSLGCLGCGASTFSNYLGDLRVTSRKETPKDVAEVRALVSRAASGGRKIRAVGSGHSSSPVAKPREGEAYLDLDAIDRVLPYPYEKSKSDRFVRIGAGAKIREVNELLAARGRALYNMGNYDAQTIAGAFSTGTHGSGISHGPIHERIVAIELVTDEVEPKSGLRQQRLVRLEPTRGISDPDAFSARSRGALEGDPDGDMVLEQNDETFYAALLSFGTFGAIVAVTVDTREEFWLEEEDELHEWDPETPPPVASWAHEYPEFLQLTLMPHRIPVRSDAGKVYFMKTMRREVPSCGMRPPRRPPSGDTLGRLIGSTLGTGFLEERALRRPESTLALLIGAFRGRDGRRYSSRSDLVSINSLAPHITATSIDIWVPLEKAAPAVNRVIRMAKEFGTIDPGPIELEWWHTSPLGLRFVGPSKALLAPSFDGPKMSIEIPLLVDTIRRPGDETEFARHELYRERMLSRLTEMLVSEEFGGRPHFGQRNWLDYSKMKALYGERFERFVRVYRRFNAHGTFSNEFSDQLCLSSQSLARCGGDVISTSP